MRSFVKIKVTWLTFRILERLQTSRLWRGDWPPADSSPSLLWKPSWNYSSAASATASARRCLRATTSGWGRPEWSGFRFFSDTTRNCISVGSSRGQRAGGADGGGGRGRGRRANYSTSTRDRRLRDWGVRLPSGCRRGLGPRRGKRWRTQDVQGQRGRMLLRPPAADLQTEGAQPWAGRSDRQHQRRPHGVTEALTKQPVV